MYLNINGFPDKTYLFFPGSSNSDNKSNYIAFQYFKYSYYFDNCEYI